MCHELGHCLALSHTDTNHYNADLGDCMDYTTTYSNNLNPGQVNFDRLFSLYGSADGPSVTGSKRGWQQQWRYQTFGQAHSLASDEAIMDKFNAIVKCMNTMLGWQCVEQLPFNVDRVETLRRQPTRGIVSK